MKEEKKYSVSKKTGFFLFFFSLIKVKCENAHCVEEEILINFLCRNII